MDWLDLLAVQGTLKNILQFTIFWIVQHHNSKDPTLQRSAFFMLQLSHPYITNGKTLFLTIWKFVGKVESLLFNMLSSFITAFLSRSKQLLISWLQSPSAVILEPKKNKVCHCFHCFHHLLAMKWWDWMPWSLFFECWVLSQLFTLLFLLHQEAL